MQILHNLTTAGGEQDYPDHDLSDLSVPGGELLILIDDPDHDLSDLSVPGVEKCRN